MPEAENTIIFNIELHDSDVFTKPINLIYKSSQEVPTDENSKWNIGLREYNHYYIGQIASDGIMIDVELGKRVFKKIK